jgi:hypothetical protein
MTAAKEVGAPPTNVINGVVGLSVYVPAYVEFGFVII